ncbi:hypothetical protein [Muricoccus radiodurans]|uniref:hypothetical protein n=1 Tax=Muricoccus radiodurans TaxID=2231721 RepID=UPI003CEA2938
MATLVPLPRATMADVPTRLCRLADDIKAGKHADVRNAVVVTDRGYKCEVHAFGPEGDTVRTAGLLALGLGTLQT